MTGAGEEQGPARRVPADVWLALGVGLVALAFHLVTARLALPRRQGLSLFGADTARTLRHMAVRGPMLDRGQFHPLFPLLTQPPQRVLEVLGLDRLLAAQAVMAAYGGVFAAAVFGTGRRRGLRPVDAAAPAALATVAGASVFFFAIPETFGPSAALAAVVVFVVAGWRGPPRALEAVGVLVLGGAAVVAGGLAPLVAVLRAERRRPRRLLVLGAALGSTLVLLGLQFAAFSTRLTLTASGESEFVRHDRLAGAGDSLRTLLVSAWAVPTPRRPAGSGPVTLDGVAWPHGPVFVAALVVLAGWWAMVLVGGWRQRRDALVPMLLVALAVHLVGFALYGDEAFLYAAPMVALVMGLVVVAASAEGIRRPLIVACWVLVPILLVVNTGSLADAGSLLGP